MSYSKKESDVLTVLGVVIEAIRASNKARETYEWPLKDDPDGIFEDANKLLAERHALPESDKNHLAENFVLLTPKLYTGKMRIVAGDGEVNPGVEKMVREQLTLIAAQRGGKLRGISIKEIEKLSPQDLEEFRKSVCSQKNGGVQFENHCLFWVGSGNDKWMHRNLAKLFPEFKAIYKVPGRNRVYAFQFAGGKVTEAMRQAQGRLKTVAKKDEEDQKAKEAKKLEARKAKKAAEKPKKKAAKVVAKKKVAKKKEKQPEEATA